MAKSGALLFAMVIALMAMAKAQDTGFAADMAIMALAALIAAGVVIATNSVS